MNSIEAMLRAEFYCDVTRNARFFYSDFNKAFNDAIQIFINDRFGDEDGRKPYSFQSMEQIRSDLFTLIKNSNPTITTTGTTTTRYGSYTENHFVYPTDYQEMIAIWPTIDGYTDYSRPTTYNEIGPLLNNSFRKPTNKKTYFNEDATGFTVWRGTGGTFSSLKFEYLKAPATFSVGNESNIINAGPNLTIGLSYIAIDDSVQNGVTYTGGTQFTAAATTTLTSGTVILASLTTPIELPVKVHDTICKMVSEILLKVTGDLSKAQAVQSETDKG
jgi:hypothetical protein